jgi:hypothetical protein
MGSAAMPPCADETTLVVDSIMHVVKIVQSSDAKSTTSMKAPM